MTLDKTATDGLLKVIAYFHPEYKDLITFLITHEDQLASVVPVIQAGIAEGPGALAAAEKAAPWLTQAIKDFVAASPVASSVPAISAMHAENITRRIVGRDPMTVREEQAWMDRATPNPNIG